VGLWIQSDPEGAKVPRTGFKLTVRPRSPGLCPEEVTNVNHGQATGGAASHCSVGSESCLRSSKRGADRHGDWQLGSVDQRQEIVSGGRSV
jgi:hypothetical protein